MHLKPCNINFLIFFIRNCQRWSYERLVSCSPGIRRWRWTGQFNYTPWCLYDSLTVFFCIFSDYIYIYIYIFTIYVLVFQYFQMEVLHLFLMQCSSSTLCSFISPSFPPFILHCSFSSPFPPSLTPSTSPRFLSFSLFLPPSLLSNFPLRPFFFTAFLPSLSLFF